MRLRLGVWSRDGQSLCLREPRRCRAQPSQPAPSELQPWGSLQSNVTLRNDSSASSYLGATGCSSYYAASTYGGDLCLISCWHRTPSLPRVLGSLHALAALVLRSLARHLGWAKTGSVAPPEMIQDLNYLRGYTEGRNVPSIIAREAVVEAPARRGAKGGSQGD